MKNIKWLLLMVVLVGCGKPPVQESEFKAYIEQFESDSITYSGRTVDIQNNMDVVFDDQISDKYYGLCQVSGSGRIVKINRKLWANLSEPSRQALMYHEFGHCAMGRDHDDDMVDGRPKSIMYKYLLNAETFTKYEKEYVNELFKR